MKQSRQRLIQTAASTGVAALTRPTTAATMPVTRYEGKDTPKLIYPEHPRGIDYDRERPNFWSPYAGGGSYTAYAFQLGSARAMMQAALTWG